MEIDAKTVADLWETIKEYVPAAKREELAVAFLTVFQDNDVDIEDIEELKDVDDDLDSALSELFDDELDEEEYE
jgi:hypothetical protein